jgi:N-acyl-D-aspartate/D-glutamate deacylase
VHTGLQPGKRADINVIDHRRLRLHPPEVVNDLSAGGKRLVQRPTATLRRWSIAVRLLSGAGTPARCPAASSASSARKLEAAAPQITPGRTRH